MGLMILLVSVMKPPRKPQKYGGPERFPVGGHAQVLGEWRTGENMGAPCPSLHTSPCATLPCACFSVSLVTSLCNTRGNGKLFLGSGNHSSKSVEPRACCEIPFPPTAQVTTGTWNWRSRGYWGQTYGTEYLLFSV